MNNGLFKRTLRATFLAAFAASMLLLCACAAMTRPAGAGAPGVSEPPKFAALAESDERRKAALASFKAIAGEQENTAPTPELQPVTATLKSLPANLQTPPRMPHVIINDKGTKSNEETRESLRRFIASAAPLLGVNLSELSLVEVVEAPGGSKTARYVQNSFPYPLRNGYGLVEVTFTSDLRVVGLSSTAIPEAEQLRRALASVTQTLTADKVVAGLLNRAVNFTDSKGDRQMRTVTQSDPVTPSALVVFPVRREGDAQTLELHIAWEVVVGDPQAHLFIYVDAVTGEQIGAAQGISLTDS